MNIFFTECCANSIQSAINGQIAGANRIELCNNLEVGGVTPNKKEIIKAQETLNIPVRILIRPRSGDFIFSTQELLRMISDIEFCKSIGCEGVVIGALNKNNSVNIEQTKAMAKAARPMGITFHRAFDEGNNLEQNLEDVIATGCDTLLTAGQESNVDLGFDNLERLIKISDGRINILAGSGVNHKNIEDLYKIGIRNFHLSGSKKNKANELETNTLLIKSVINKIEQIV
ncbi:MAG: copper homeostasis protein CutC [Bacteroidota bacterium]|nr:copper homeostasis protein CutC [Bacteroidota bacterium]